MSTEPAIPNEETGFDPIPLAAQLLLDIRAGTLATLDPKTGFPLATLVTVALDADGVPLIMVSDLSHHTRNLRADDRYSLLLAQSGKGDPLAHPRVTLVGRAALTDSGEAKQRFTAQNPKSKLYADFTDFAVWRLEPVTIHLNGGFARAWNGPAHEVLDWLVASEFKN